MHRKFQNYIYGGGHRYATATSSDSKRNEKFKNNYQKVSMHYEQTINLQRIKCMCQLSAAFGH